MKRTHTTYIKIFWGALGLVLGLSGTLYLHTFRGSAVPVKGAIAIATSTQAATAMPEVIDAVYPLYSAGISWSPNVSVSLPPRSLYNPTSHSISGYQVLSYPTASTEDIGMVVGPMRNYYDHLLLTKGWSIDTMYEADGAGGSLWGFTKGKNILILSYTSTFMNLQPNTPAQCPCTIVFTIIGGTLK